MKIAGWTVPLLLVTVAGSEANAPQQEERGDETASDIIKDRELALYDATPRIVGGNNARVGEYPYFVQGHGCGGSMIWKDIVLTAAHCHGQAWQGNVIVGAYRNNKVSDGAESIPVKKQIMHPQWGGTRNFRYDYMVVALKRKASKITPKNVVKLAGGKPYPKEKLTTMGMGMLADGSNKFPTVLQTVDVTYITGKTCANKYYTRARTGSDNLIYPETMICASSPGKDSCFGDSGSPIIKTNGYQVGIVSWGIGCARSEFPGVYSLVPTAISWIKQQICTYSRAPPAAMCGRRKKRNRQKRLQRRRKLLASTNTTTTSTCFDSDEIFDLDDQTVDKDCAWLQANRFSVRGEKDLCDWLHISYRCPNTCDSCDDFPHDEPVVEEG